MSNSALWEWVSQALKFCEVWLSKVCVTVVRLNVSERRRRLSTSRKSSDASLCGRVRIPQVNPKQPIASVRIRRTINPTGVFDAAPKT